MFTFYGVRYRSKQIINNNNNGNGKINWKNKQIEPFDWSLLFGVPGERISLIMR